MGARSLRAALSTLVRELGAQVGGRLCCCAPPATAPPAFLASRPAGGGTPTPLWLARRATQAGCRWRSSGHCAGRRRVVVLLQLLAQVATGIALAGGQLAAEIPPCGRHCRFVVGTTFRGRGRGRGRGRDDGNVVSDDAAAATPATDDNGTDIDNANDDDDDGGDGDDNDGESWLFDLKDSCC